MKKTTNESELNSIGLHYMNMILRQVSRRNRRTFSVHLMWIGEQERSRAAPLTCAEISESVTIAGQIKGFSRPEFPKAAERGA